jgi:hypothetical protein
VTLALLALSAGAGGLVDLLIVCLVVGAILCIASLAAAYLGAPPLLMKVIYVVVCVVAAVYAIRVLASML